MKIAVIGGGISGIIAAHYLAKAEHEVVLYEANDYLGGHTDTHEITIKEKNYKVDTGFIVFNEQNYPNFNRFLNELGVESQVTNMSFSVSNEAINLEYNATNINKLFCQRRNVINPYFYKMIFDIFKFYREAPAFLDAQQKLTLGEYLQQHNYSKLFIEEHILPMAAALWSTDATNIRDFPVRSLIAFMHNHKMLQVNSRPIWKTVKGGSNQYVNAFKKIFSGDIRLSSPVKNIIRSPQKVVVHTAGTVESFDAVVLSCHSDQALRLLDQPSMAEKSILGAIKYQRNEVSLHHDKKLMPKRQTAWASWNVLKRKNTQDWLISYDMNQLQNLNSPITPIVTLNANHLIDPNKIWMKRYYSHPFYNQACLDAQSRYAEISGVNNTYYCGAYWGWGFHEDGVRSALDVVATLSTQRGERAA